MREGDKVILKTFNGSKKPLEDIDKSENYWILIGISGEILKSPNEKTVYSSFSKEKRLLVKFHKDVNSLGLHCHNAIDNALWILETDLDVL